MAKFYLSKSCVYERVWFSGKTSTFYVALGYGAPFGKGDTSYSWLISFLNIGRGVLSSSENCLIFGVYCPETGPLLVQELVYFRGIFLEKASQWPNSVYWTIRNLKNVVDNFVKR